MATHRPRNGTISAAPPDPVTRVADSSLDGRAAETEGALRPTLHGVCALSVLIEGTTSLLMHRYDVAAIEHRASAPKGSAQRRTDDPEEYLYRTPEGRLSIPATNVKRAFVETGRYFDDPRSSGRRRQATDLFRASLLVEPESPLLLVGGRPVDAPEFLDRRRAVVQRQAVARTRPGLMAGWRLAFRVVSLDARYVAPALLREALDCAGRYIGLGDFRPDFGRVQVVSAVED